MITLIYHEDYGRSRKALATLAGVYLAIALLVLVVNMSLWIAAVFLLFTLPALWEAITGKLSTFEMTQSEMQWTTTSVNDALPLGMILKARFDTRLDLSVRVTFLLKDGRKLRLPHACTPSHEKLETALKAQGIHVERHHFSLIG